LPVKECPADDKPAAERVLEGLGLTKNGKLWILPEERQLRERLTALERAEKRHRDARAAVDQLLDANDAVLTRLTKLEETIKKTRDVDAAAKAGSPQRKQLDVELKNEESALEQLRKQYVPADKLGTAAPLRPALIDVVNARTEVTLKLLAYRDTPCDLPERYEQLAKDHSVAAAIAESAENLQLGPQKGLCDRWRFIVESFSTNLFSNSLPVYRDGHAFRFTAIIDERRPLTFTLNNGDGPVLIPQDLAEAAGLSVGDDSPKVAYRVAEGRDVKVQKLQIGQVRLGGHVSKNVPAYILPPEAADIGARIGPNSLPGVNLHINPVKLQVTMSATSR
jgi:hypothetical protein